MINSVLDDVLDRTVVAGFTNVGYRIRSRGWSASEVQRMEGRVALVTGASSGLGLAAAAGFALLGATVWLGVRSPERASRRARGSSVTIVWLGAAAEPGRSSGLFWHDRRPRPTHRLGWARETRQERERLLAECLRLSGWHDASVPTASTSIPEGES